ncbi:hypothetical protein [Yoonia sp. GPGPB17]|uniref:hypothetical protein n=1 Tax=Yoonia sp. GPGPB17 TaxID=3026147 RepID=UPI004040C412
MKGQSQDRDKLRKLREETFTGVDIVDEVVRLSAMNLYLHGVGDGVSPVHQGDALSGDPGDRYKVILTNRQRSHLFQGTPNQGPRIAAARPLCHRTLQRTVDRARRHRPRRNRLLCVASPSECGRRMHWLR